MRAIAGYDCHGNITNLIIWNLKKKIRKILQLNSLFTNKWRNFEERLVYKVFRLRLCQRGDWVHAAARLDITSGIIKEVELPHRKVNLNYPPPPHLVNSKCFHWLTAGLCVHTQRIDSWPPTRVWQLTFGFEINPTVQRNLVGSPRYKIKKEKKKTSFLQ
jgi:hypothetical protein